MKTKYHPKGSMCAACVKRLDDCSHLEFAKVKIVACKNREAEK